MAHKVTVPPALLGASGAGIAVPFVRHNGFGEYETKEGATSLTAMVTVAVSEPPLFVAVTV